MSKSRTWISGLAAAAMMLLGAGEEPAEAPASAPGGVQSHATSGTGVVEAKDTKQDTLTIGGQLYHVGPSTRIVNRGGEQIPLSQVPVARVFRDDPKLDVAALVDFEATETAHGWVLELVRLQAQMPQ